VVTQRQWDLLLGEIWRLDALSIQRTFSWVGHSMHIKLLAKVNDVCIYWIQTEEFWSELDTGVVFIAGTWLFK
jgi:hypothetical protein